ncbi:MULTISPECIES: UPF0280 family protein [Desulfosediminicola]|uniref:UPF0280 family protein n=1 Tax=Desulfosediminicola TaxID=2886823 RepID=UPI001C3D2318|nr:UPF0280 family protein [Desulfosediminicola ganghwensis]
MGDTPQKRKQVRAPESYVQRDYRLVADVSELSSARVCIEETDLHISCDRMDEDAARDLVLQARLQLQSYIDRFPEFATSLIPRPVDESAPALIRQMLVAARATEVGPMAAVAGTLAEYVGNGLLREGATEVIVENGGDIFLSRKKDSRIAIFAGQSPLSYNVGIKIAAGRMPCGVCTSSGTVGHSLSFGDADSVTVLAESTALADAAATRLGNEVGKGKGGKEGVNRALAVAKSIPDIRGVVVICGEVIGAAGEVELVSLS